MVEAVKLAHGKVVVLKTVSGEEIVGKVVKVKNGIVVLKLFKATIFVAINKIIAVVIR
jgi:vacuolar-type H+-ATPase subunit B/Vma2